MKSPDLLFFFFKKSFDGMEVIPSRKLTFVTSLSDFQTCSFNLPSCGPVVFICEALQNST